MTLQFTFGFTLKKLATNSFKSEVHHLELNSVKKLQLKTVQWKEKPYKTTSLKNLNPVRAISIKPKKMFT